MTGGIIRVHKGMECLNECRFITALSNQKRIIYKQPRSDPVLKEDLPFKGLPMRNSVLECP